MDTQWIINTLFGVVGTGGAWFINNMWRMMQSLQGQVVDLSVQLAKEYITRAEVQRTFESVDKKLDEIQRLLRERP